MICGSRLSKIVSKKLQIEYNSDFRKHFGDIWDYIADDSVNRANEFKNQIRKLIETLEDSPYCYRQSLHYDNENVRDLIFKGYTIIYKNISMIDLIVNDGSRGERNRTIVFTPLPIIEAHICNNLI